MKLSAEDFSVQFVMGMTAFGVEAFWAECKDCPSWRCHKRPHDDEETAVRCAERHSVKHVGEPQ